MRTDRLSIPPAWFVLLAIAIFSALLLLTGCNQQRYQPAKWRRSTRANATTLPAGSTAGTTLPARGTTLPGRGTTLPYRGTTLPANRTGTTLPMRFEDPRQLPAVRGGTTLPN